MTALIPILTLMQHLSTVDVWHWTLRWHAKDFSLALYGHAIFTNRKRVTQIRMRINWWLVQERCNSMAHALELNFSCTNPLILNPYIKLIWFGKSGAKCVYITHMKWQNHYLLIYGCFSFFLPPKVWHCMKISKLIYERIIGRCD